MKIVDRIIGIWMVFAGITIFDYAVTLEPYMGTLSGYTLYAVAIFTSILLGVPIGVLIGYGVAQAIGAISINVEGGK